MFRFYISAVVTSQEDGKLEIREKAGDIYEAPNWQSAAAEAESRWPGEQISVTKIGRVHSAGASNQLPMAQAGGA